MCRVLGCVASEPVSLRYELLEADNPLIGQSEHHDSGWGIAAYRRGEGEEPTCRRFPIAAFSDNGFEDATNLRGRIINAHLRRATMGGLVLQNTHPFCLGPYSFGHNGTILHFPRLLEYDMQAPKGTTDSEHFFQYLMSHFDRADIVGSLRRAVTTVIERSTFSGMNFLFGDGERLYAYKLGIFELYWLHRPGQLLVASERITESEPWHCVAQDVLLTLDPRDVEEPHAERLVGDELVERADITKFTEGHELRGEERGRFAEERAARMAAAE
ncbi:MAG TPA: class II glutamine amidotransferase [Thermoleophilaceae bacterium]|jgi:glutamine amidotransferase